MPRSRPKTIPPVDPADHGLCAGWHDGSVKELVALAKAKPNQPAQHAVIAGSAPAEFSKFVAREIVQWKAVAKAGNIRAE